MHEIFKLCLFTLFYYQLNNILKPCIYNNFEIFKEEPIVFYPIIQTINIYILYIFFVFLLNLIIISKNKNYTLYSLSFIYIKYIMDNNIDIRMPSVKISIVRDSHVWHMFDYLWQ